jgi:WxL Interacting Protein, peptidoglycan binding domain
LSSDSRRTSGEEQPRGCSSSRAIIAIAALLAAIFALPATAAGALPFNSAKIGPFAVAPEPNGFGQARPFFQYTQVAGSTVHDRVAITNLGDIPLTFDLYAADAYNTATGSFQVQSDKAPKTGVGSWVTLPVTVVTVPPHTRDLVPFSLAVATNATPGDHAGGIVALLRPVFPPRPGVSQTITRQGIGARIYLRVPGALKPGLAVTGIGSKQPYGPLGGGRGSVSATIADTGNTMLDATVHIRVTDIFGRTVYTFPPTTVSALLPGNSATIQKPWPQLPHLGRFNIHVSVTAAGANASGAHVVWVLPWLTLLIAAVLALALIVAGWWWRKRRRGGPAPASGPDPSAATSRSTSRQPVARRQAAT